VRERIGEVEGVKSKTSGVVSTLEGLLSHWKEMQRLKARGGKA
jgi:hypothetical protein